MTYGDRTRGETTKADGVYLEMRNQILYGVLEPGSRVDYGQLSASLGVSITPLREALRRLEADHLVIRIAHRDVVIAPLTREEASDLVQVRQELDLLAARLAASQMTGDELAAARELVESQDEQEVLAPWATRGFRSRWAGCRTSTGRFTGWSTADRTIRCSFSTGTPYRPGQSGTIIVARQISAMPAEAYRLMHSRLLAALEARDAAAAAELMRAHYRELDLDFADVIFGPPPRTEDPPSPPRD